MQGMTNEQREQILNCVRCGLTELDTPVTYNCASWAHSVVTIVSVAEGKPYPSGRPTVTAMTANGDCIPNCDISREAAAQIIEQLYESINCPKTCDQLFNQALRTSRKASRAFERDRSDANKAIMMTAGRVLFELTKKFYCK